MPRRGSKILWRVPEEVYATGMPHYGPVMRFLLFLSALLLASCGGQNDAGPQREPGTIVRIADAEARGLDPQIVSELVSIRIASDQFEGLTRFSAAGMAEPGLARDWTTSPDGKLWTFHLRPGLVFSDRHPIDASVFVDALARIRAEKTGSPHISLFAIIDRIEAPDRATVLVRLTDPFPQLPALLAHPALAALPFHIIKTKGEAWTGERPLITSGPYRLTQWRLNQALTLQANPFWHDGKPASATVIWRPVENKLTAMRLILAGGADTSSDFPDSRQSWLSGNYPRFVHVTPYLGTYYFVFNTRRPPFNDRRVRQALSMAVDRQWMTDKMIAAGNEPAWELLPPSLAGGKAWRPAWASWTRQQRMDEARRLLAQAGYGPQKKLVFDIRFNSSSEHRRAAVAMASMWRELGVEARMLNSEAGLHFDSMKRGDFDLARSGWIADLPAPENFLAVHRSDAGAQNYSGYANTAYDAALQAALAEPDPVRRLAKMRSAEAILLDDAPLIPLYFYVNRVLISPHLRGWKDNDSNMHPSRTLYRVAR